MIGMNRLRSHHSIIGLVLWRLNGGVFDKSHALGSELPKAQRVIRDSVDQDQETGPLVDGNFREVCKMQTGLRAKTNTIIIAMRWSEPDVNHK